jgi:hypothetical protein
VETTPAHRWNQRGFVALSALLSGLALPITGLADHLAGHSSNAGARAGWSIVHTSLGVMFVFFCTWHAVLNRRPLLKYLRAKAVWPALPTREAFAALALVGGVLFLTVTHAMVGP